MDIIISLSTVNLEALSCTSKLEAPVSDYRSCDSDHWTFHPKVSEVGSSEP